ncbi:MAG: flavodoxin domain-containing protein [Luteolibacter sp.]
MLLLFATMTGNAEDAAKMLSKKLKALGHETTVANIEKFTPEKLLSHNQPVGFVVSTWGEGEPPDEALDFWELLEKQENGSLQGLRYSVYALGDSYYDEFCGFGKNLDQELERKGATRIAPRVDNDTDYEEFLEEWVENIHSALKDALSV